ncbi:MAG: SWIM zinc finger family protein [Lachnospiraceae bacterium]|nr:SWIM zinc finger family protein [Lachnospiraceae bacterium]
MQTITEQQIIAMAPNQSAVANAKKISQKGGFVRLECSADDTFYLGECSGSGKSNYITSVDFIDAASPVCRCTCPSRQFPCKHGLALLFEISAKKTFGVCEIPDDIQKKREKKQARAEKAENSAGATVEMTEEEAAKKKASAAKSAKNAKVKKIKKQLEGLELAEKLVTDLMKAGLGTMGGTALKTYEQLSKQLGDYYLPGPQRLLNGLIIEIAAFQKDGKEEHYEAAIDVIEKFWTLIKKSKVYLKEKLEKDDVSLDNSELYEELGGIWKLSGLEEIGSSKANVNLIQLAFWVNYDAARKEYIDTGCWADLATGQISMTYNYRPVKALKYVKQEDTTFGVAQVPMAAYYPGQGNQRVRWEGVNIRGVETADITKVRSFGVESLATEAKAVKNIIKNALADPIHFSLISYEMLGKAGESYVLKNAAGETIMLGDCPYLEGSVDRIGLLPDGNLMKNQVLLGAFYYDDADKRLKLQPISIVTENDIVRLLY